MQSHRLSLPLRETNVGASITCLREWNIPVSFSLYGQKAGYKKPASWGGLHIGKTVRALSRHRPDGANNQQGERLFHDSHRLRAVRGCQRAAMHTCGPRA